MSSELIRLKQSGFTKRPNRTAVETWIEGYLKLVTSGNRLREESKFIEKAIIMINTIFGHPCCDSPSIVNFGTPNDNQLTNTIRETIQNGHIIRRSFRLSLLRILDLLNDYLYGCCTQILTINFPASILGTLLQVQIFDANSGDIVYTTLVLNNTVQTATLPAKYFGPAAVVKVCLNVIVPAGGITNYYLQSGANAYVNAKNIGLKCSTLVKSLPSSFTVSQA